jgi:methylglutaconyl-CoA hydratase
VTTVRVTRTGDGAVAWVTLCRPEAANALSRALIADLREALTGLRAEAAVAAVVLTGAGDKAFSAGADLKERRGMSLAETQAILADLNALMDEVATFPRAVIAAINGAALGGGLELALAADIRICAQGATLGLPEVRLGIIPGAGGTQRLARLIGVARAKELILTGRRIDAAAAQALGLVSEVVPAADLPRAAATVAGEIAEGGPLAVSQAKRAIDDGFGRPLADGLAVERAAYQVVLTSADRDEGLLAFAEKRKPRWSGK